MLASDKDILTGTNEYLETNAPGSYQNPIHWQKLPRPKIQYFHKHDNALYCERHLRCDHPIHRSSIIYVSA